MDGTGETPPENGFIDLAKQICSTRRVDPYHDPVGVQEIFHRRSFAQKLGVGSNVIIRLVGAMHGQMLTQLRSGLHRHCAFFYDQAITGCLLRNRASYALNGGQVRITVGQRRSSDTDEDGATVIDGLGRRTER